MGTGQTECTFYIPQAPQTVDELPITLTQLEQSIYDQVARSPDIEQMVVEFHTMAHALLYDHDFFSILEHNHTNYPPLVTYSK